MKRRKLPPHEAYKAFYEMVLEMREDMALGKISIKALRLSRYALKYGIAAPIKDSILPLLSEGMPPTFDDCRRVRDQHLAYLNEKNRGGENDIPMESIFSNVPREIDEQEAIDFLKSKNYIILKKF